MRQGSRGRATGVILTALLCLYVSHHTRPAFAEDTVNVQSLIDELGASDYKTREHATDALWHIGTPARELLIPAAGSDDPEVRIRARQLLSDIGSGIRPSWPKKLRDSVRRYDALPIEQKKAVLDELLQSQRENAIPFLLKRIAKGDAGDAEFAIERLSKMEEPDVAWRQVLESVQKPTNKYEARILALACMEDATVDTLTRALGCPFLEKQPRNQLIEAGVELLRRNLDRSAHEELKEHAAAFAELVPNEARFFYLQAIAATELGDQSKADELCRHALTLNPDAEAPHYVAGDMLKKMGQFRLSEPEWKMILEIEPTGDVYDLNALTRLGSIYEWSRMYGKAADAYQSWLEAYQKAKAANGNSIGLIGTDVDKQGRKITWNRARAAEEKGEPNDEIVDAPGGIGARSSCNLIIKDDRLDEMLQALDTVAMAMRINVEPHGLRLLKETSATLQYDRDTKSFSVMLNGAACSQPAAFELTQPQTTVAVEALDMCYVYQVDRESGAVEQVAAYEKDYTVMFIPAGDVSEWQQTEITLNDEPHTWEELREGVHFDYLPKMFQLDIRSRDRRGVKVRGCIYMDSKGLGNISWKEEPTTLSVKISEAKEGD